MTSNPEEVVMGPEAASRFKRVRYAYVILALISVVCAVIAVEIALAAIRNNNQNFCDLVGSLKYPAPVRPVDPANDRRGERSWVIYNKVVRLDQRLGCNK
jgi:hypothetical protein